MNNHKLYLTSAFVMMVCLSSWGQVTLINGNHVLELTGSVSAYYNQRVWKEDVTNFNKDRFKLRDAQIQFEGRIGNTYEYELQVDFADMAAGQGAVDPENPGLMDAYITYKGLKWVDITAGYGKLFYGRSSLVPFVYSPYWQRAEFLRGDLWSRRDVGITLSKSFWKQRVNLYAGAYTGLGELSLLGDNDASGKLEYVGRIDIAYPSRYRYRDIDTRHVPLPMVAIGFNGRYANKTLPDGRRFPEFAEGEYGIKVINGERTVVGMDVSAQYRGFSAQLEMHRMEGRPERFSDPLLRGLDSETSGGYFRAGGYMGQLSYFSKKWKSIFSCRFEEMNLSDLVSGTSQRASFAYAYQIDGFRSMIKFQYFNIISEESAIDPLRWTEQFRIGYQLLFH